MTVQAYGRLLVRDSDKMMMTHKLPDTLELESADALASVESQPAPHRRVRGKRQRTRGQALVELAVIATTMMFMGLSVIEVGRASYTYLSVTHAARDGARYGMVPARTAGEIEARVVGAADPVTLTRVAVSKSTTEVSVSASVDFEPMFPLVDRLWGGGTFEIQRTMVARVGE